MDLQVAVKQKSSQLMVRRNALFSSLVHKVEAGRPRELMFTFVVIPFALGFIYCRVNSAIAVMQYFNLLRASIPLRSFLKF